MADERIRRQIAFLAAQMMYHRTETEYFTAKRKAAPAWRRISASAGRPTQQQGHPRPDPGDGPHSRGAKAAGNLRDMRLDALRMMRLLARFRPRLIGSVRTGHVRKGSDIDLHIFCDSLALVTDTLDELGLQYDVEHKRIVKYGEERTFTHIHLHDGHNFELTLYPEDKVHYVFKSSITGKAIERASIAELEELLRAEHPDIDLEAEVERIEDQLDPYLLFRMLLGAARRGQAKPQVSSGGGRPLSQLAGLRAGARGAAVRRGVSAGRPIARRRQGHRPFRPRRGGLAVTGRVRSPSAPSG